MALNPNWPVFDFAINWTASRASDTQQFFWTSVTDRTEGNVSLTRGKQYELAQVQPGTAQVTLRNDDGAFDPNNGASLYAGFVLPHRMMRIRAQWPPTVNMLTADQATAFFATKGAGGAGATLPDGVFSDGSTITIVNSGSVNHYRVAVTGAGQGIDFAGLSMQPGQTYSVQCLAQASVAAMTAKIALGWFNAAGALLSVTDGATTAVSTSSSTPLTVTGTCPAGASGFFFEIETVSAVAGNLDVWAVQAEKAAAPSTWAQPGTWYPIFTGFIERWPQGWDADGNYGSVTLTLVDVFAWFASLGLDYAAYLQVLAPGASWLYPLDDPAGTTAFAEASGNVGLSPLPVLALPSAGAVTAGQQMAATAGYLPLGTQGNCAAFANDSATLPVTSCATLDLASALGQAGPVSSSNGLTRIIAFRDTSTVTTDDFALLWVTTAAGAVGNTSGKQYVLAIARGPDDTPDGLIFGVVASGTTILLDAAVGPVSNGGWHLFAFTISSDGQTVTTWLDGVGTAYAMGQDVRWNFKNGKDQIGGWLTNTSAAIDPGHTGQMALVAELPYEATELQIAELYLAFRYAWKTSSLEVETSGTRYERLLNLAGYNGPQHIETGALVSYGPATDLQGSSGQQQATTLFTALENVVESEVGEHFVAADGTVTFLARSDRYNITPSVALGEHAGEIAYSAGTIDYDPTQLANDITSTAQSTIASSTPATARAVDTTSQGLYGDITASRTINTTSSFDLQGGAEYLLYLDAKPQQRISGLTVDLAANPSLWPTVLGLELCSPITVNRRPAGAPATVLSGFLEQIQWSFGDDGSAKWTPEISSGVRRQFAVLDDAALGLLDSTAILAY